MEKKIKEFEGLQDHFSRETEKQASGTFRMESPGVNVAAETSPNKLTIDDLQTNLPLDHGRFAGFTNDDGDYLAGIEFVSVCVRMRALATELSLLTASFILFSLLHLFMCYTPLLS